MVYPDSNILIYLFEDHPEFGKKAADYIEQLSSKHNFTCSTLTITECMATVTNITLETFRSLPAFNFAVLDEEIAAIAAHLRRKNNLRIGDAIHLATALHLKADVFLTNDKQLAAASRKYLTVKTL